MRSRYSASNALWRARRFEQDAYAKPTPTPEDLACRIYTVTLGNDRASMSFPMLAADEEHAYELADARAAEDGCGDRVLNIVEAGLPHEQPSTMEMLLAAESFGVKEDRRLRVRDRELERRR